MRAAFGSSSQGGSWEEADSLLIGIYLVCTSAPAVAVQVPPAVVRTIRSLGLLAFFVSLFTCPKARSPLVFKLYVMVQSHNKYPAALQSLQPLPGRRSSAARSCARDSCHTESQTGS